MAGCISILGWYWALTNNNSKSFLYSPPPWIKYPNHGGPFWGGWAQGEAYSWFMFEWRPFWNSLSAEQVEEYLRTHPVPEFHYEGWTKEDWLYVLKIWRGESPY